MAPVQGLLTVVGVAAPNNAIDLRSGDQIVAVNGQPVGTMAPGYALWDAYASQRIVRGLSAFVAIDNLADSQDPNLGQLSATGAPSQVTAHDLRPWMAALFGLIHGFGFAAVLIEFGLPQAALGWSLAAFNLGVEIGQLFIVLALLALGHLVARLPAYRVAHAERFLTLASAAVIAAGVYWLAERIGLAA